MSLFEEPVKEPAERMPEDLGEPGEPTQDDLEPSTTAPGDPSAPIVPDWPSGASRLWTVPPGSRPKAIWPSPSSEIAGVIGFPVRHSLSPRLQNTAFSVMGLDWCYLAFEVPPGSLEKAVAGAAALGFRGLSVTMPHKDAAARVATRHSRQVRRLGAANTLVFDAGAIRAESCDGEGLLDDLREGLGFDPVGKRCGVIGAGGAGRATVLALSEAGADEIIVVNRTAARAWRSVALAPKLARVGRPEDLKGVDLVVQATPAGMLASAVSSETGEPNGPGVPQSVKRPAVGTSHLAGLTSESHRAGSKGPIGGKTNSSSVERTSQTRSHATFTGARSARLDKPAAHSPSARDKGSGSSVARSLFAADESTTVAGVDPSWFGAGQLVVDLIYDPPLTSFLLEAQLHGATVRNGLGMLVHQAARQIRLWTGMDAPLQAMWEVAREQWPAI